MNNKERLKKLTKLLTSGTVHPDYTDGEDAVRCRDCKCHVHEGTATKAAGFDINSEYLCRLCVKHYEK